MSEELLKVLQEGESEDETLGGFSIATLMYPTIRFDYEARLISGKGPITFDTFVSLKGKAPEEKLEIADKETGLMWKSHEFIRDVNINGVDFSADNWEELLKAEMVRIAKEYAEKHHFSLEKANF